LYVVLLRLSLPAGREREDTPGAVARLDAALQLHPLEWHTHAEQRPYSEMRSAAAMSVAFEGCAQCAKIAHCFESLIAARCALSSYLALLFSLVQTHELWALLNFLLPRVFTTSEPFDRCFNLTTNSIDQEQLFKIHTLLKPLMLRRIKSEIQQKLPKKTEIKIFVNLTRTYTMQEGGWRERRDARHDATIRTRADLGHAFAVSCVPAFRLPLAQLCKSTGTRCSSAATGTCSLK
jgi:hypothetical protein